MNNYGAALGRGSAASMTYYAFLGAMVIEPRLRIIFVAPGALFRQGRVLFCSADFFLKGDRHIHGTSPGIFF
jgi:hypothetical protein